MSPAVQTQKRDWWEVAGDHYALGRMADARASVMSATREGRTVDGTQGLISTLPKSLVLAKKRLSVAS